MIKAYHIRFKKNLIPICGGWVHSIGKSGKLIGLTTAIAFFYQKNRATYWRQSEHIQLHVADK